jgi:DNA replication licensing factor MCM7
MKSKAVSDLSANEIGSLVMVRAIVVRASEIKPELTMATYICDLCGCENYMEVFDNSYKPLDKCMSKKCIDNKVNGKLTFLPSNSKFKSIQYLKIQETPDQLKDGRIPRTYALTLKESQIKTASPGDIVVIQGILLPRRNLTNYFNQNDLSFECHLEAVKITREKKRYLEMGMTADQRAEIEGIRASLDDETLFTKMAASIAPEIYGM